MLYSKTAVKMRIISALSVTSSTLLQVAKNVSPPVQCIHGWIAPVLNVVRVVVQYEEHHEVHSSQVDHYETERQ
jgi:hypothetical protein